MTKANLGDVVNVHYTGSFADGDIFDSSSGRDPLQFKLGEGQVIPGFEQAIVGMEEGESKTVTVMPEHGYGERRDELIQAMPRERIPEGVDLEVGKQLQASTADGGQLNLTVVNFDDDEVTLDANHPLAGRTLVFQIELVGIA